ncbi:hypothetical protein K504DRAFT_508482 [Pleomassaria siparia CBS 279.74]|uniref:Uncharacterized protein n=1 Tax=Pleomassaria siparia CBS 279.74 TaxID=1314801 RepID=A0A6G1JSD6_9PLEO|nr:hypothetical protein K504DRAFT_508482 [Pleomassaria siparia CBS 279.74]
MPEPTNAASPLPEPESIDSPYWSANPAPSQSSQILEALEEDMLNGEDRDQDTCSMQGEGLCPAKLEFLDLDEWDVFEPCEVEEPPNCLPMFYALFGMCHDITQYFRSLNCSLPVLDKSWDLFNENPSFFNTVESLRHAVAMRSILENAQTEYETFERSQSWALLGDIPTRSHNMIETRINGRMNPETITMMRDYLKDQKREMAKMKKVLADRIKDLEEFAETLRTMAGQGDEREMAVQTQRASGNYFFLFIFVTGRF